jgi:hypothetical protein
MKKVSIVMAVVALTAVLLTGSAQAGVPLVNLEGVGGVAFNPLAYPAATFSKDDKQELVAKPRFGVWYVNLNGSDIDWTSIWIADTFFKRLELSYGYESVNLGSKLFTLNQVLPLSQNVHKSNFGAKALLLEENSFGTKFVPAVSVGAIYKTTTFDTVNLQNDSGKDGFDAYFVATKLIPELPRPVLLSAGVLSTSGQVNGILGFNDKRDTVFFGNIDVLPLDNMAIGFEYKQGAKFDNFKNANYWNVHAAWFVNKNLSLVAAYADAGDRHSTTKVGLGGGPAVSAQYEF